MTHVTTDVEENPIIMYARNLGVESINLLTGEDIHSFDSYTIFLNGN